MTKKKKKIIVGMEEHFFLSCIDSFSIDFSSSLFKKQTDTFTLENKIIN
jgi:hypothetical protein